MRIKEATSRHIRFDNNSQITFNDTYGICPVFGKIENSAFKYDFEEPLDFEEVRENGAFKGFRFGNKGKKMFFVEFYSVFNKSGIINISYHNKKEVKRVFKDLYM